MEGRLQLLVAGGWESLSVNAEPLPQLEMQPPVPKGRTCTRGRCPSCPSFCSVPSPVPFAPFASSLSSCTLLPMPLYLLPPCDIPDQLAAVDGNSGLPAGGGGGGAAAG